ncbi:MAG: DUF4382 domain-containing protein [Planctomycetota bacterium]
MRTPPTSPSRGHRLAAGVSTLLFVALAGCGGGGSSGTAASGDRSGLATLRVHVTDAPFPFAFVARASVVVHEVAVHERTTDAWEVVFAGATEIDLVPLTGGLQQLLVEAQLPPGTYDRARLVVAAGEVELTADAFVAGERTFTVSDGTLVLPSGATSGLKVAIEGDLVVTTALSADLLLDFDLARNFVFNGPVLHAPGVRRVLFTPVVRATNVSTAGTLVLDVASDAGTPDDAADDLPLAGATVRAFAEGLDPATDAPTASVATDAAGAVSTSLPPGRYLVVVEADGHVAATRPDVVVVLANATDLGTVTLHATAAVRGTVTSDAATTDPADDVPVAGAAVVVRTSGAADVVATTTSDASGAFQVAGLAAGTYDVEVSADGFEVRTVLGVVAAPDAPAAPYVLRAHVATLRGTVTDAAALPVEAASVVVTDAAGDVVAAIATAADGTFALPLPTGTYHVTVASGAAVAVREVAVVGAVPPPVIDVTFAL